MGVTRYDSAERDILVHVGKEITRRRIHRGWTQKELGDRVGERFQVVQKWECGATAVSLPQLCKIAVAFGLSPTAFLPTEFCSGYST